jgi:hypothetical protein
MTRAATLARLRGDVAEQADIAGAVGGTSAFRYQTTLLNRLLNQGIQRFRERLSTEAGTHYLVAASGSLTPGVTSLPSGASGTYQFGVLAVPTAAVRTYGVDVTINGETRSLGFIPFTERSSYGGPNVTGEPQAWTHFSTREIALFPAPNQGYSYMLWYLPVAPDLVADTDTFDGVAGWEDYITWDTVCRLIVRDQYPSAYQMAVSYRSDIWADILRAATKVSSAGGGVIGRDTFGQRMAGLGRNRRLPSP